MPIYTREINDQQRKFADAVLMGCSYEDAARAAGYSDGTIKKSAHTIAQSYTVSKYLTEKKANQEKRMEEKRLISWQDKVNICAEQLQKCIDNGDHSSAAKYIKILNDMQGHNSAQTVVNVDASADTDLQRVVTTVNNYNRDF